MAHSLHHGLYALLLSTFAIGCAVAVEDTSTATVVRVEDTSSVPATPPTETDEEANPSARAGGNPVYFGEDNALDVPEDVATPPSYTFEMVADAHMTITLSRRTEKGPSTIGFTLHRVTGDNEYVELGTAHGQQGSASMALYTVHGGTYAINLLDGLDPALLMLSLECDSGTCAPRRQPGEACGGDAPSMQCDKGLVCLYENGVCETSKEPGHCEIVPTDCVPQYEPVCGCDDRTWGNECFARQAGVSILRSGECETK